MRTRWSTVADTLPEVEAVGDTRNDAHAVVDNLANTLEELEELGDSRINAHALVDTG